MVKPDRGARVRTTEKENQIVERLRQGDTYRAISERFHCAESTICLIAQDHPELDRNLASYHIRRRLNDGGWTIKYIDKMSNQTDITRYYFGMFLKWWKNHRCSIGNLDRLTTEDLDAYANYLDSRLTNKSALISRLYVVVNGIVRVEAGKNWSFLRARMRTINAKFAKSRYSEGTKKTSCCTQAPLATWPAEWLAIYLQIPDQDIVAAHLGLNLSSERGNKKAKSQLKDAIVAFIYVMNIYKRALEITTINLKLFVFHYSRSHKAVTTRNHLRHLASLAKSLGLPQSLVVQIRQLQNCFASKARYEARRKDGVVLPSGMEVIELARRLMMQAREGRLDSSDNALLFQSGLMLLFLAFVPLRAQNFADLTLENWRTIRSSRRIQIDADQMKNRRKYSLPIPEVLCLSLDEYVEEWRLVLRGEMITDKLWVTHSKELHAAGIQGRLAKITEQQLGIRVSLHDFRDIAASTAVMLMQEQPELASTILGHISLRTLQLYIQTGVRTAALKSFHGVLAQLAKDLRSRKRHKQVPPSDDDTAALVRTRHVTPPRQRKHPVSKLTRISHQE